MEKTKKVIANGLFGKRTIEKNTPKYALALQHSKRALLTGDGLKSKKRRDIDLIKLKEKEPIFRLRFGGYKIPLI